MSGLLAELVAASRTRPIVRGGPPSGPRPSLAMALAGKRRLSLVAEWKRRSPSEPQLAPGAELLPQVRRYAGAGAAAVSVLTEPTRFGGSLLDLRAAAVACELPLLRKDFLVRPQQVAEAVGAGASAVLLIARCLEGALLAEMIAACRDNRIEALVECHDEAELERSLGFEDVMIGVNNRDLDTLKIDREVARRLLPRVPAHRIAIAESGYGEPEQLQAIVGLADAVLIGSALMKGGAVAGFAGLEVR